MICKYCAIVTTETAASWRVVVLGGGGEMRGGCGGIVVVS